MFTVNERRYGVWQDARPGRGRAVRRRTRAPRWPRLLAALFALALCALPASFTREAAAASFSNGMYNSKTQAARHAQQAQTAQNVQAARQASSENGSAPTAPASGAAVETPARRAPMQLGDVRNIAWRVRILEAAAVDGPLVRLGEIAVPVGEMPEALWLELAGLTLWEAPADNGKPMSLSRPKLQQAMLGSMGRDFAMLCFYPQSLTLQRGGSVLGPAEVMDVTVKTLTPLLASLPGESSLSDFRLPETVFLGNAQQVLELERPARLEPGRLSLKFAVRDLDGSVVRRFTGTVFVDSWAVLPCAAASIGKDEVLEPEKITFIRKNLAQIRVPARPQVRGAEQAGGAAASGLPVSSNEIWDGKGGPWRATRAIPEGQPILVGDLSHLPTVTKGSVISLIYNAPTVRLSVRAEALADGVRGQSIPVRNQGSNRQVYATVIDDGVAVIESGFSRATADNFRHAAQAGAGVQPGQAARYAHTGGGI